MFIKNAQWSADAVCSCDMPHWRPKSWDISDVKGGKVSNFLSEYTEINSIHKRKTVNFIHENINKN
jgi:hypothetical protein